MRSRETLATIEAIQISFTFASPETIVFISQNGNIFLNQKSRFQSITSFILIHLEFNSEK
jgi:hypothetical protein